MSLEGLEREKQAAAAAAAELVRDGMVVGLGTGTTVAYLVPAIARRGVRASYVATSPRTEELALGLGLEVGPFDEVSSLDLAIDGADQIAPDGWLVKGGGGAHTREKVVAGAAERFVVIADSSKPVAALSGPVPLELLAFGLEATLHRLDSVRLREAPRSPDGGVIADLVLGLIDDPARLAAQLGGTPGVVEHGLFPPSLVTMVLVGRGNRAEELHLDS
jgi:ribose 5-phosphate isomerase A